MLPRPVRLPIMLVLLSCLLRSATIAEEKPERKEKEAEPGCLSYAVKAVTDRPTLASGTETTQCGVIEFLSGPERLWAGHQVHQEDVTDSVQFGLTPRLDLHYGRSNFFSLGSHGSLFTGTGDSFAGLRFRISRERRFVPSFGSFYTVKIPTASPAAGMGTGRYDHAMTLIVSKDLPKVHVDFNVAPTLAGRPDGPGYDRNTLLLLFSSIPVKHGLTLVAGSYGFTKLNADIPAYATGTVGVAWQAFPRLILDVGYDEGLTAFAPRKRIGFGLTVAPANLYVLVRRPPVRVQ